jgi:hypothetical protein
LRVDLPAGLTSISTPNSSRSSRFDHLLEVRRGRLEGLLEGALDLVVDFADQRLELTHRPLGVLALRLQLFDVVGGLFVFALGERVDRADLGTPAVEPLEFAVDLAALVLGHRQIGGRHFLTEFLDDRAHFSFGLGAAVTEVGGLDLGLGQRFAHRSHLALQLELEFRAGAQLLGDLVAVAVLADHGRFGPFDPGADRVADPLDRDQRRTHVLEQLLPTGQAQPHFLPVALAEQALGAARVADRPFRSRPNLA